MPNGITKETYQGMTAKNKLDVIFDILNEHTEILKVIPYLQVNVKWMKRILFLLVTGFIGLAFYVLRGGLV